MSESSFFDIAANHVLLIWPLAREHVLRALNADDIERYRPEDVLCELLKRQARLWVAWDPECKAVQGIVVSEILTYPNGFKELRCPLVGGRNLKDWLTPGMETLKAFGRSEGCQYMTGGLRKGWLRIDRGFRQTGITVAMRL